jgi:hypothetical protein
VQDGNGSAALDLRQRAVQEHVGLVIRPDRELEARLLEPISQAEAELVVVVAVLILRGARLRADPLSVGDLLPRRNWRIGEHRGRSRLDGGWEGIADHRPIGIGRPQRQRRAGLLAGVQREARSERRAGAWRRLPGGERRGKKNHADRGPGVTVPAMARAARGLVHNLHSCWGNVAASAWRVMEG